MTDVRGSRSEASSLEDWGLVRAAQHMIEIHGARSAAVAVLRAERAEDDDVRRRWRRIATTIRKLHRE